MNREHRAPEQLHMDEDKISMHFTGIEPRSPSRLIEWTCKVTNLLRP
jgi:hypothetical protein